MNNYRLSRGVTAHYSSLEELREAYGLKPFVKRTNDANKLQKQQEVFCGKHKCKACGKPMVWTGGNVMTCQNPACKGIKVERETPEGKIVSYVTSYDLLDDIGAEIAGNIF